MKPIKINGQDLKKLGYQEGPVIGLALETMILHYHHHPKAFQLDLLKRLLDEPAMYKDHKNLGDLARALLELKKPSSNSVLKEKQKFAIFGEEGIDYGALNQMHLAMRLPISRAGALMPDAHQGYGLPIGGVLATENAVIPYGVGMDIGCRMCLSVYDEDTAFLPENTERFRKLLMDNTRFGHAVFESPKDHKVLERPEFKEISVVRSLKDKAHSQIGTSGGGNHFVEFGWVRIEKPENPLGLEKGRYLAVLSHSGSRGLGANIAQYYTKLAMEKCDLPKEAQHLAWLDLDTEAGQEYWLAMTLAGDYASACHHQIHDRLSEALGSRPNSRVENHHNFAWKEKAPDGGEWIVHRKGATPAGKGDLGIIPGSMTAPGFIVEGLGNATSIHSAAHGAGRVMSRRKAKETLSKEELRRHIVKAGISLIGSGMDEAPMVYKDIHQVMSYQEELVNVVGTFTPKVVRMCGDNRFMEVD